MQIACVLLKDLFRSSHCNHVCSIQKCLHVPALLKYENKVLRGKHKTANNSQSRSCFSVSLAYAYKAVLFWFKLELTVIKL